MRYAISALLSVTLLGIVACTAGVPEDGSAAPTPDAPTPAHPAPTTAQPTGPAGETTAPVTSTPSPPPHPVSLPALFETEFDGRDLTLGTVLDQNADYTRHAVTYRSGDLTVSGIMNVPAGDGPFPVLILAHGYIDPAIYTTGRGLAREQDYLARAGYAVLHTDYRNHAGSDADPDNDLRLRLGYVEDVINAVLTVRESDLPFLDGDRVGLLGRSMGGGITYDVLVTAPGLVDAAVVYAPVSSDAVDNFERWVRARPVGDEIIDAYGEPADEPEFWSARSARTFFDRVTEPILIHHGTADDTCPIEWSYDTVQALESVGADAELIEWEGEPHAFERGWHDSIVITAEFFDAHLGR